MNTRVNIRSLFEQVHQVLYQISPVLFRISNSLHGMEKIAPVALQGFNARKRHSRTRLASH